jgi:hypothetical protein
MTPAPIALFVYNRPEHTKRTLESLRQNRMAPASELFIYADGPKPGCSAEALAKIKEVRRIIREEPWCGKVHIVESETNKGLSHSILSGASEILDKFGKAIVLEDDMVTSAWFLSFMNDSLQLYEHEEQVACISGYSYPLPEPLPDTYFIRGADCWGWATWKRAWDTFERDGVRNLRELEQKKLAKTFEFEGTFPYMQMLRDQIEGRNDSWAIRWYASAFLANQLTLYPGKSFVENIGADGSGTHGGTTDNWKTTTAASELKLERLKTEENTQMRMRMSGYFKKLNLIPPKNGLLQRVKNKIKRML